MQKENTYISNKIFEVTFFKGIAILMIIFVHFAQIFNLPTFVSEFSKFFQMGCQIFLVLSCFTLCISYNKKRLKYFDFMKKRIKRLSVGYWTMIFFYLIMRILIYVIVGNNDDSLISVINPLGVIINILFLNGIVPNDIINNKIVLGGWFVGTIVVLYALFPLLFKIFNIKNRTWNKIKNIIFPIIIEIITSLFIIFFCKIFNLEVLNNKFIYFSFVNQLSCFSLGFTLYNLYEKSKIKKLKLPLTKGILFLILSILMFYAEFEYSFIFLPFIFGISFIYLYVYITCNSTAKIKNSRIAKFIERFGNYNWTIYLCHSAIIYYFINIVVMLMKRFLSDNIIFIILLPITYVIIYYCGKIFNIIIVLIENKLNKRNI